MTWACDELEKAKWKGDENGTEGSVLAVPAPLPRSQILSCINCDGHAALKITTLEPKQLHLLDIWTWSELLGNCAPTIEFHTTGDHLH